MPTNITPENLAKYGNFDLAMDSFYHQENLCVEGIRELYFPIDNSFEEYVKANLDRHINLIPAVSAGMFLQYFNLNVDQDYYKSGVNYVVYVMGAPPSQSCFKVEIYCNYECLPNAEFLNYLPLSMNPMGVSNDEKRRANLIIQQKPVMKVSEADSVSLAAMPSIWSKMERKFKGNLPGIRRLKSYGLINSIPGLKPGIALANTMINLEEQMEEDI